MSYHQTLKGFIRPLLIAVLVGTSMVISACAEETQSESELSIAVYKTPTCGCCSAWVEYLQTNGFRVTTYDLDNLSPVKNKHGLTDPKLMSCHTAIIDDYVVEGHVPVDDIRRLLSERPPIIGITAPGMPQLSPGMNSLIPKDYDVLSFDATGKISLFSRY